MKLESDTTIVTIGACHLSPLCHIVINMSEEALFCEAENEESLWMSFDF